MLGGVVPLLGCLCSLGELKAQGGPLQVVLCSCSKGATGQHVAASLTLVMQSVSVSNGAGGVGVLQPHSCVLGFSQWRLVLKQFLVVLVEGSKVRMSSW